MHSERMPWYLILIFSVPWRGESWVWSQRQEGPYRLWTSEKCGVIEGTGDLRVKSKLKAERNVNRTVSGSWKLILAYRETPVKCVPTKYATDSPVNWGLSFWGCWIISRHSSVISGILGGWTYSKDDSTPGCIQLYVHMQVVTRLQQHPDNHVHCYILHLHLAH